MRCSIDGCDRTVKSRGWCNRHYMRWFHHGDPLASGSIGRGKRSVPVATRFWSKVDLSDPDGCWPWKGAMRHSYAEVWLDGKKEYAHRVAYFMVHGEWPPAVCHHCDNPPCCRPDHLFGGTQADNLADMRAKQRGSLPPRRCPAETAS